jgi:hypothetical protein
MLIGDTGANSNDGAVYVYRWNGTSFVYDYTITQPSEEYVSGGKFGIQVYIACNELIGVRYYNAEKSLLLA